ncbi:aryl-sulfate sulfotransferase [Gemmatirosa kalamazoonensis]|nr:aryl-sulfate sulfotransferase [Gemmatirosa kalamazoonensis]
MPSSPSRGLLSAALVVCATAVACSDDGPLASNAQLVAGARANGIAAARLPNNALGAAVTFTVARADSARLRYWTEATPTDARTSPFTRLATGGAQRLPLLGLAPSTVYRGVVETMVGAQLVASDSFSVTTGALPAALASLHVDYQGTPTAGYAVSGYRGGDSVWVVAFDSTGRLAWYRGVEDRGGVGAAALQPNGDFTVYTGGTSGWNPAEGYYVELRPDGSFVRNIAAPAPYTTDNHELVFSQYDTTGSHAYFTGFTASPTDLSSIGGPRDTLFASHRIFAWTPAGASAIALDDTKLFTLADRIDPPALPPYDLAHPNAIDVAPDGDIVVSWRNMGEVTKLDPATGAIRWRLGGTHSTLTIVNDPLGFFSGQHSVRMIAPNRLLMFDNGQRHAPQVSRLVEYEIDATRRTATLVWSFTHPKGYFSGFTSVAQRLPNGNTFGYFSTQSALVEVTPNGAIVSEGILRDQRGLVSPYRVTRIASLYGRAR